MSVCACRWRVLYSIGATTRHPWSKSWRYECHSASTTTFARGVSETSGLHGQVTRDTRSMTRRACSQTCRSSTSSHVATMATSWSSSRNTDPLVAAFRDASTRPVAKASCARSAPTFSGRRRSSA
eukprot:5026089-Prymnesium_polylepis.1